ncbi:hypothetical protein [Methanosarcina mazei]|uniref:Uncharacterized protein n=1 Tax=Methanosarcina mazei TaxID=2209 RepID=A0A0F8FT02_METMZ|nr:hypothetical protein [Methanosarcina mazei]KKG56172.1 hypothetical protein DU33_17550 [Methanosarcina mazei]KKG63020.1 hypothetical protein DU45_17545 [Methanosarcina mazei]KKG63086.1 hypothetical protein DU64_20190 [Methanosarcina mazei]
MDLLALIKDKCYSFSDLETAQGLRSIILHLEVAERHLDRGRKGDDYLFTDVIYRTNQAFEGSLKEAYRVLTGNLPEKIKPYKIELYFEEKEILKERVLLHFRNYRDEWRNESTHNYKLYFSEQEAFLAIVNVCAFCNILLDQMIEKNAYNQEKDKLSKSGTVTTTQIKDKSLIERVSQLLIKFSTEASSTMKGSAMPRYFERELIGMINAYIDSADDQIEVITEYAIPFGERKLYADLMVRKGESSLLIEVKKLSGSIDPLLYGGKEQLLTYMNASGINNGILYIPGVKSDSKMITREVELKIDDEKKRIVEIFPENY